MPTSVITIQLIPTHEKKREISDQMALACKTHRRIAVRRKLQILRSLTKSKSVKKSSIIADAFLYIYRLREAIKKECQHLINHIQEVKVENLGKGYLVVRVRCSKGEEMLASVAEVFDELNLNIVEASISCQPFFGMEAIIKADIDIDIDAAILNRALLMLLTL